MNIFGGNPRRLKKSFIKYPWILWGKGDQVRSNRADPMSSETSHCLNRKVHSQEWSPMELHASLFKLQVTIPDSLVPAAEKHWKYCRQQELSDVWAWTVWYSVRDSLPEEGSHDPKAFCRHSEFQRTSSLCSVQFPPSSTFRLLLKNVWELTEGSSGAKFHFPFVCWWVCCYERLKHEKWGAGGKCDAGHAGLIANK